MCDGLTSTTNSGFGLSPDLNVPHQTSVCHIFSSCYLFIVFLEHHFISSLKRVVHQECALSFLDSLKLKVTIIKKWQKSKCWHLYFIAEMKMQLSFSVLVFLMHLSLTHTKRLLNHFRDSPASVCIPSWASMCRCQHNEFSSVPILHCF